MPAAATKHHQSASPLRDEKHASRLLEVFREMAEARAVLCANGVLDLQLAVDELWSAAMRAGLVKSFGPDEIQRILAESFARWRLSDE